MSKETRVLNVLKRWVNGEISTSRADRELEVAGVEKPKPVVKLNKGNIG